MRAAIYHGAFKPLTVETVELDEPKPNEVIVRTAGSGVCHSDYHYLDGSHPMPTPALLGHEAAGIVERVGAEVTRVAPGDHVVVCGNAWCGQCEQCLLGHPSLCTAKPLRSPDERPQMTWDGQSLLGSRSHINAFAEQMLLHERQVARIPDEMPLDVAALIGCAVTTGVGAAINTAGVRPMSTVAVFGMGGVGMSVLQGAYLCGARRIVAVDLSDERLEMARRVGATHTVNGGSDEAVAEVVAICGDGGADYSFDAAPDSAKRHARLRRGAQAPWDRHHHRRQQRGPGAGGSPRTGADSAGLRDGIQPLRPGHPPHGRDVPAGALEAGRHDHPTGQPR